MKDPSGTTWGVLALLCCGAGAVWDLQSTERGTIVVYTTPALRDLLEKDIVPRFQRESGHDVALVYVPAGQQYNRLRMSGGHPEADVLLHASPLYLEKGFDGGHIEPVALPDDGLVPRSLKSRPVDGTHYWRAFAWSPLVEVFGSAIDRAPDLATSALVFGFPHPVLSNNGIYAVLFFEEASPVAGARALAHTRVQPVNARANISGVADGSFSVTMGYEAVVRYFQAQGAEIEYELPLLDGQRVTTSVVFSAGLVRGRRHAGADALVQFLFTAVSQGNLARFHLRGIRQGGAAPDLLDLEANPHRMIDYDWSQWRRLEEVLPRYEVRR